MPRTLYILFGRPQVCPGLTGCRKCADKVLKKMRTTFLHHQKYKHHTHGVPLTRAYPNTHSVHRAYPNQWVLRFLSCSFTKKLFSKGVRQSAASGHSAPCCYSSHACKYLKLCLKINSNCFFLPVVGALNPLRSMLCFTLLESGIKRCSENGSIATELLP